MPSTDILDRHTPEVQDILGTPPRKIVRYGMSFFGAMALLLVGLAWWVRYPDTLTIPCTLTADSPAVSLNTPASGRIAAILVKDNQLVKAGQAVAVLDDAAQYESVLRIRKLLAGQPNPNQLVPVDKLTLGELQTPYLTYRKAVTELHFFRDLRYHERKINALRQKLTSSLLLRENLAKQAQLNEKDARLGQRVFDSDSALFARRGLTPYEYVSSERTHVREQSTFWQSKSAAINADVQLDEIRQAIVDLELEQRQKEQEYRVALEQTRRDVKQRFDEWERKNVIIAATAGILTFNIVGAINQTVKDGEVIATVIPTVSPHMYCKARMPVAGSGKVKTGQRVQVRFDNYPAAEFGSIAGQVQNIALIPGEKGYLVLIKLPQGLRTSYGTYLPYKHDITGTADIITADQRLLERLGANFTNLLHRAQSK